MDNEVQTLINRAKLAAECAEKSGFYATSEALLEIATKLADTNNSIKYNPKLLPLSH